MIQMSMTKENVALLKNNVAKGVNEERMSLDALPMWKNNVFHLSNFILRSGMHQLESILNQSTIVATMFVGNCEGTEREYKELVGDGGKADKWRKAIRENTIGEPKPFSLDATTSGNLVHSVYHIKRFEDATKIDVKDVDLVLEFGGGYGSMCRAMYQAGFGGKYLMYDLSTPASLQHFYARSTGYDVEVMNEFSDSKQVYCFSDVKKLDLQLSLLPLCKRRMFVASWSISVSPEPIRRTVFEMLRRHGFEHFLIAFQWTFEGINNDDFFAALQMPNVQSVTIENTVFPANRYWFGWPK